MTFTNKLFEKLKLNPSKIWIEVDDKKFTKAHVLYDIEALKEKLSKVQFEKLRGKIIGIAMKTSYDFVIADLTCLKEKAITLPVPLEFEDNQIKSLLKNVEIVLVNSDSDAKRLKSILPETPIMNIVSSKLFNGGKRYVHKFDIAENIIKIIHTSGTTSEPKGVLIKDESLNVLIDNLLEIFPKKELSYLSLNPLSLLVEQIFAIYSTLLTGGRLTLLPNSVNEFGGYSVDSNVYFDLIRKYQPNFMYLPPKLLNDLNQFEYLHELANDTYYITGGAKIEHKILRSLDAKGIRVYEGYGLSETTSVVSINGIDNRRIGTAGKILPHLEYKVINGELLLKGETLCAGYFTKDESSCDIDNDGYLHTGDLVEVDEDRYLTIKGRKKNLLILSNARNISSEWVESKLKEHDEIDDCVVIGEGKDFLTAIILTPGTPSIAPIINKINKELPSFAQIKSIINIKNSEGFKRKYFTVTGRPKRSIIHKEIYNDL